MRLLTQFKTTGGYGMDGIGKTALGVVLITFLDGISWVAISARLDLLRRQHQPAQLLCVQSQDLQDLQHGRGVLGDRWPCSSWTTFDQPITPRPRLAHKTCNLGLRKPRRLLPPGEQRQESPPVKCDSNELSSNCGAS